MSINPVTTGSSTAERALADAKYITATMLELIDDATNLNGVRNLAFRRALVAAIPFSERQGLTITELEPSLSEAGLARTTIAILARVYGDADLMANISRSADDEVKSIRDGLLIAAPRWAKFRAAVEAGDIREEFDLTPELIEAIKRIVDLGARGQKLVEYLRQHDTLDNLPGPVEAFMRMFYDPTENRTAAKDRIADELQIYAEEAALVTNDPRFGAQEATLKHIQSNVLRSLKRSA